MKDISHLAILDRATAPDLPGVYVLGCFARRVTFLSQQHRSFNLVWALFESGKLTPTSQVAVVGGGLAGMTCAAAASLKGCKVTLFEAADQLMHIQRGNHTRFVHPNIYDWPMKDSEAPATDLPCMNWKAGTTAEVVAEIEAEWDVVGNTTEVLLKHQVEEVSIDDLRPSVTVRQPRFMRRTFDCVILAVGFGFEKTLGEIRSRSYWADDDLHQPILGAGLAKHFLVAGCGDGGLIDALRLTLKNFDHGKFCADVLSATELEPVKGRLLEIEAKMPEDPEDAGHYLWREYETLEIPESVVAKFKANLRVDTSVTLNASSRHPLNPHTSILNRFIIFLLIREGAIHYEDGTIKNVAAEGARYTVQLLREGKKSVGRSFDDIVVRHGPKAAIGVLLDDDPHRANRKTVDPTGERRWPTAFFLSTTSQSDQRARATENFGKAYARLYRADCVQMVGIGTKGGAPAYVVSLSAAAPNDLSRISEVDGIPVVFEELRAPIAPQARSYSAMTMSSLPLTYGERIGNLDAAIREGGHSGAMLSGGALGCFVQLSSGQVAILSAGHVLNPSDLGRTGDRIARIGDDPQPIGTLIRGHKLIRSSTKLDFPEDDAHWNEADVAVVALNPDIEYVLGLPTETWMPRLAGVGDAVPGERVMMFRPGAGAVFGYVRSVSNILRMEGGGDTYWFRNAIEIIGDKDLPFSAAGDSGALIVRMSDAAALGMVFAGSDRTTVAFPIRSALQGLECRLLAE